MTKKIFWQNPYETTHETAVKTVNGAQITLHSTIFFAFSGGQESDSGSIGSFPVVSATKNGPEILYLLNTAHTLTAGQIVLVQIDWVRRYRLMRLHFAAELVLELFYRSYGPIEKLGAHISEDKARIDFALPQSIAPMLPELTTKANAIVARNLPIHSAYEDEEREIRYWEIEGFSKVPCGGTHVKSTGEVGPMRLKRNNKGQGKERVEIFLDT